MDTNQTNSSDSQQLHLAINIIFQFDAVLMISSSLIHIFYFFLIFKVKEMHKRTHLYLHHSIFIGFLFNFHYLLYYGKVSPNFGSDYLNMVFCKISEEAWSMIKNMKTYSVALVALYRFIGVFKIQWYREINKSKLRILIVLVLLYIWIAVVLLATKYGFNTTYGKLYCMDGYSEIVQNALNYFLVESIVGFLFPTVFSIVAYIMIKKKLDDSDHKTHDHELNQIEKATPTHITAKNNWKTLRKNTISPVKVSHSTQKDLTSNSLTHPSMIYSLTNTNTTQSSQNLKHDHNHHHHHHHHHHLAKQFFMINLCQVMSCLTIIGLGTRYVIPSLNEYYSIPRFLLRFFCLFFTALTPVIAIAYNPLLMSAEKKLLKCLFDFTCFRKKKYLK